LKRRCPKWARMTHLDICNTKLWPKERPGVKLARKVRNRPDYFVCMCRATCHWKGLNKGYNFGLDLIPIGGLHKKLWTRKVAGVPTLAISGFPLGSPGTKSHLNATPARRCRVYYIWGEGGGFPWVWAVVNLVNLKSPVALPSLVLQPCANQLVCWFYAGLYEWVNPIPKLQHAPLPL
jgi:hypothetical protein